MNDQSHFWNERFGKEGWMYGQNPNAFIASQAHRLAPQSHVLCLAEGEGRNAIHLAQLGHHVTAIDASDIGLAKAAQRAQALGVALRTLHMDLHHWEPQEHYDAIVASFIHLPQPLRTQTFTRALAALRPKGVIIMESFSQNQLLGGFTSGGPKDLEMLYNPRDLEMLFAQHPCAIIQLTEEITLLDEGWGHQGDASVVRLIIQKE
ncbi:MAG: hypothetical protein KU37_11870 [Sulfuricurvum sp. PC08-66]|nr:MAG: hypothetical protein KU37_11870 [Sulfuricurvum sp. PC08-66]